MSTEHLISCAEYLLNRPEPERTQVDINRAASTHYYALFHELAWTCATLFIGPRPASHGKRAWQQVYRALEHKFSKDKCRGPYIEKFPPPIRNFAIHFAAMQERRHQCDYDPLKDATVTEVLFDISRSKTIVEAFRLAEDIDKRAFCAYVLFKNREDPEREAAEVAARKKRKADAKQAQRVKNLKTAKAESREL